ncbi:MAG TPA: hypothetical protein DCR40_08395 [Prolixibacteraceae bacterium]|nr:hypothetical protein [Prolixibacteraceae bacterium]
MNQTARYNTRNSMYLKPENKKQRFIKSDSIKLLELMADEAARKRYPNVPYLAPRKFRDDSANGLTNCIIQFLQLSGHQAERINSTGRRIDTRETFEDVTGRNRTIGISYWIKGTGTNGTADISSVISGNSVKVEVKFGRDRQSQAQRVYQKTIEQAGGLYVIATSFEQFLNWYCITFKKVQKLAISDF